MAWPSTGPGGRWAGDRGRAMGQGRDPSAGHGTHGRTYVYALPKHDRDRQLTHMYRSEYEKQFEEHKGDKDSFRMKYKFCGFEVCRAAFMKLTGCQIRFCLPSRPSTAPRVHRLLSRAQDPQDPLEPHWNYR